MGNATIPSSVEAVAAKQRFGSMLRRVRQRPGLISTFLVVFPALLIPRLLFGAFTGAGTLGSLILLLVMTIWVGLWLFFATRRWRSGLYIFEHGLVEAKGGTVVCAFPWATVRSFDQRSEWFILFPIPLWYHFDFRIVYEPDPDQPWRDLQLDLFFLGLRSAARLIVELTHSAGVKAQINYY
jgi:hypothetical protein